MSAPDASILFVSQQLPWPLDSGGNIRTYHLLSALARRYRVTLVSSAKSPEQAEEGRVVLGERCAEISIQHDPKSSSIMGKVLSGIKSLVRSDPAVVVHNENPLLAREVRRLLETKSFDVVHLNHIDTYPYVRGGVAAALVIDTHNLLHRFYERRAEMNLDPLTRALCGVEARKLKSYEFHAFVKAARVLVCSDTERRELRLVLPKADPRVVPNGVDGSAFQVIAPQPPTGAPPTLVFVGDMGYGPNHQAMMFFIREVMPLLKRRPGGVRLRVVGKDPAVMLCDLASGDPAVEITGWVDNVRDHVQDAALFVVPLQLGTGTRLKILEAFALGLATVSTTVGAEGIDCRDGHDILIADSAPEMAAAIARLLDDPALARSMAKRGRQLVDEKYDWELVGKGLVEIYEELLGGSDAVSGAPAAGS